MASSNLSLLDSTKQVLVVDYLELSIYRIADVVGRSVGWLVTQLCGGRTAGLIQMLLTYVSKPDDTPSTKIDRYCPQTKTCHLSGMSTDVLTADLCRMTSNVFDFVGQLSGNTEL